MMPVTLCTCAWQAPAAEAAAGWEDAWMLAWKEQACGPGPGRLRANTTFEKACVAAACLGGGGMRGLHPDSLSCA